MPLPSPACWTWLLSVRFLTIFIAVFFVIAASVTTGGVLWSYSVTSADQLGAMVMRQVQVQVQDAVLTSLHNVVEVSKIGAGLARQHAMQADGTLNDFITLNKTAWFNLKTINSFTQITNAGTFLPDAGSIWYIVFRTPNGEQKSFFQNCTTCLSQQWLISETSLALLPEQHLFTLPLNVIGEWREKKYLPTFDPAPGKEAMWGGITWGVAVPAPLVRVFVTWIRGENGEFLGMDYKGVDLLQLNTLLHKVRPEGDIMGGDTLSHTRIYLQDENGFVVGATHGGVGAPVQDYASGDPNLLCKDSEDAVVRASCPSLESASMSNSFSVEGTEFMFEKFFINDEYGLHFTACIAMPRDFVFGEVERGFEASITASVTVIAVSIFCTIFLSFWLTQPLVRFVGRLEKCAEMDVHKRDRDYTKPSVLREIAQLEVSFRMMEKSLYEFKTFIPNTLFIDHPEDVSVDDDKMEEARIVTHPAPNPMSHPLSAPAPIEVRSRVDMLNRSASVLVARESRVGLTPKELSEAHTRMTSSIETVSNTIKCVFTINADCILVSFNTTIPAKHHAAHVIIFANELQTLAQSERTIDLSVGFATGPVQYGIAGTSHTKTFAVYGSAVNDAYQLSLCSGLGCNTLCTYHHSATWTLLELAPFFPTVTGGRAYTPFRMPIDNKSGWMYEVEAGPKEDVYSDYAEALGCLERGDEAGGTQLMRKFAESREAQDVAISLANVVLARLDLIASGVPIRPTGHPQYHSWCISDKPAAATSFVSLSNIGFAMSSGRSTASNHEMEFGEKGKV